MEIKTEVVQQIARYNPFREQLKELIAKENTITFDYESEKGNKEARSYVFSLRKSRTAIDEARKLEKAESIEYGKRVDLEAKEIMTTIEGMITKHDTIIKQIEKRETDRVDGIRRRIENLANIQIVGQPTSVSLKELLLKVSSVNIDETFGEWQPQAQQAKDASCYRISKMIDETEKIELERKELQKLRILQEEQRKKDLEAEFFKRAEEKAKLDAENAIKKEREEFAKKELAAKIEAEQKEFEARETVRKMELAAEELRLKNEQEKRDSEKRYIDAQNAHAKALQDALLKEKAEREERELEAKKIQEEKEKNKKHKEKMETQLIKSIAIAGFSNALEISKAIIDKKFSNVTLNY